MVGAVAVSKPHYADPLPATAGMRGPEHCVTVLAERTS